MNTSTRVLSTLVLWLLVLVAHAGTVTYVYTDPQGTPLAEADATGTITARFDYAPYGMASTASGMSGAPNGPGYTGHVNDPESEFVYMQARYYDPQVGRFLSTDPVGPTGGALFNFGRYTYADNNPILYIDADGKESSPPRKFILPHYSQDLRDDPLFSTVGKAMAADAAFLVAVATDDSALQATAVDAMQETTTDGQGASAAIALITMGKEGEEINVAGVKMEPTTSGARTALESAGHPGTPISNKKGTETGTLHNVPKLDMDVRVMDGGPHHGPRITTNRTGTSQKVQPSTGKNFGNIPKSEQNAQSHIPLRQ